LTGTNHAENQPIHLKLPSEPGAKAKHTEINVESKQSASVPSCLCLTFLALEYAGLLGRACPAAVYEYQDAEGDAADAAGKKFVINSQNCIHVSISDGSLGDS
jgi:electron-transferring-flavoprotein dehydrogenase